MKVIDRYIYIDLFLL